MAEFRGKKGHWVTTESGSHLFIEDEGTYEEAVEKAFGKENAKKYKKYEEDSDKSERANIFDTDEEYKENIKSEIAKRYEEYKKEGLSQKRIKDELYDEFGYQDLIDDVMNENESFDNDNESDFEDNSYRANFIVENYGDLDLTYSEFDQVESILSSKEKTEKFKNIVKENLDLGDGEEEAVINALENFKESPKSESFDADDYDFLQELYGTSIDNIIKENYPVDEIGPDKKEQEQIKKEIKQRKKEGSEEQASNNNGNKPVASEYRDKGLNAKNQKEYTSNMKAMQEARNKAVDIVNQEEWYDQKSKESVIQAFTDKNTQKEILKNIKNNDYFASYYYDIERVLNNGGEGFSDLNNYAKSALAFVAKQTLKK